MDITLEADHPVNSDESEAANYQHEKVIGFILNMDELNFLLQQDQENQFKQPLLTIEDDDDAIILDQYALEIENQILHGVYNYQNQQLMGELKMEEEQVYSPMRRDQANSIEELQVVLMDNFPVR